MKSKKTPARKPARQSDTKYPIATVAYYGPDDQHATKVVVGIITEPQGEVVYMRKWASGEIDVRRNMLVQDDLLSFIRAHQAQSVIITDRIIGCPHEEGEDYPEGQPCPMCEFWKNRDRWTGEILNETGE